MAVFLPHFEVNRGKCGCFERGFKGIAGNLRQPDDVRLF